MEKIDKHIWMSMLIAWTDLTRHVCLGRNQDLCRPTCLVNLRQHKMSHEREAGTAGPSPISTATTSSQAQAGHTLPSTSLL